MSVKERFQKLIQHKYVRQFSVLVSANFLVAVISFVSNVLITNHLNVHENSDYRFVTQFLQLGVSFFTLGLPISASRLLARENDREKQRRIIGAGYIFFALVCLVGLVLTYAVYFGSKAIGYDKLPVVTLLAPWLLYITILEYGISNFCTGTNDIKLLSSQAALPVALLTVVTIVQVYIIHRYSLVSAFVGFALAHTVIIALGIYRIQPSFAELKENMRLIWKENRTTGLPVYIGGLISVSSLQIIGLAIKPLVADADYAFYTTAYSISAPLSMVASTLGTVLFRSSASQNSLPRKVFIYSGIGCAVIAVLYLLFIGDVVHILFRKEYAASVGMARIMGVGALMVGIGDIINRFLGANGKGRHLMIGSIFTGVTAVVSALLLFPTLGATGAAISRLAANIAYFIGMIALYKFRNYAIMKRQG